MKLIFGICLIALLASQAQAIICQAYYDKLTAEDYAQMFTKITSCVMKKADELEKYKDTPIDLKELMNKKQIFDIKFDCFNEIKSPSYEIKELFQCLKNYYEAKFDTSLKIPTLEDQSKGTDSDNWGDEELKQQVEDEYKQKNSPTSVVLYIFCVVLGIAILALIVAIIFSKYRMHVNKESSTLGTSSFEFGSSASYQKQADN